MPGDLAGLVMTVTSYGRRPQVRGRPVGDRAGRWERVRVPWCGHGGTEQAAIARQTSEQLRVQTRELVTALRRPEARGRWGELQPRWLADQTYWGALSPLPEFVILFIPGEAFLAPALERDPGLLGHALARKVHIATPTTLVTMLRTAQFCWQQAERMGRVYQFLEDELDDLDSARRAKVLVRIMEMLSPIDLAQRHAAAAVADTPASRPC
jgi:RmuC family